MTTQRTTTEQLEAIVTRINMITNSPLKSYETVDGKYVAQVGNYHLSQAYGGFSLHRMGNESGGTSDVLHCGHVPKKELANLMHAFIRGLNAAQDM